MSTRRDAALKAAVAKKRNAIGRSAGTVSVYVRHGANFFGRLRPAHDSAPDASGDLTEQQVSQLKAMIARYVAKCVQLNRDAMTPRQGE